MIFTIEILYLVSVIFINDACTISDFNAVLYNNFLGLYINSKLNWDTHTNVIDKRISRAVGIMKKCNSFFQNLF